MGGMIPIALDLSGIFSEDVVIAASVVAGLGLIWWSLSLYRLAGSQTDVA